MLSEGFPEYGEKPWANFPWLKGAVQGTNGKDLEEGLPRFPSGIDDLRLDQVHLVENVPHGHDSNQYGNG